MEKSKEKYLGFILEDELYGISISKVQEVIRYVKITTIHEDNVFLKGVINLRGKIIPIIDMRLKFNIEEKEYSDRTVFIVVFVPGKDGAQYNIGMAVDAVSDVVDLADENIEKAVNMGLNLKQNYLYGITQINDRMMMILNIDKILTVSDVMDIKSMDVNKKEAQVV